MRYFINIFILIMVVLLYPPSLKAQYDMGMYSLRAVPQANLSNPAFMPDYQYHFGFPGLSSVNAGFGTSGAKYDQLFSTTATDSLAFDPSKMLSHVKKNNNVSVSAKQQWINAGMRYQKFYFSFSLADVAEMNTFYSKNLVSLFSEGNAAHIGQTIDLTPLDVKVLHYREYAFGAAYDFNEKWNFGVKAKLLFGKSAINTKDVDIKLTTTEDYYYLDAISNFTVNTSLPNHKKDSADVGFGEYSFSAANLGFGFDFGATYKMDEQWSFSASVLDLGVVQFDRWITNYTSNADVLFKGIDINQFEDLDGPQRDQKWEDIQDSLVDLFDVTEDGDKFKVPLTAKVYLGANYQLSANETVGALLRMEIVKGIVRPSLTASYFRQIDSRFGITANYTIANRSYLNLGVGVVANFEPLQVYFVTDNLYGIISPNNVRYTNFHFGINFIIPSHKINRTMFEI